MRSMALPLPVTDPTGRALGGDAEAWGELIRLHQRRVVVALLGHGLTLDQAKDAAQEAWAHLLSLSREGRIPRLDLPGLAIRQALFFHARPQNTDRRRAEL